MLNIQSTLVLLLRVFFTLIYIYILLAKEGFIACKKEFFLSPFKDANESAAISGVKRDINHHHGLVRFRLRR